MNSRETFEYLKRELKALEVRLDYASVNDLPYTYTSLELNGVAVLKITIFELSEYKNYLRKEILNKKKQIALLNIEDNRDNVSITQNIQNPIIYAGKSPRLKLSRKEEEQLNERIYKEIEALIDERITQNKAFIELSRYSEKKLGYSLTIGQVEGRYKRYKKNK